MYYQIEFDNREQNSNLQISGNIEFRQYDIDTVHLETVDVSKCKKMTSMFLYCDFTLHFNIISKWDVSACRSMWIMFKNCPIVPNISEWDTSAVRDMGGVFKECGIVSNISGWNTKSCRNLSFMFYKCHKLNQPLSFNIKNINIIEYDNAVHAFKNCYSLKI